MKTPLALLLLLSSLAFAQATHSVTLTWVDALNPAGTTYNVYRAVGLCSGTPIFSKLAISGGTAKTATDVTVTPGPYCYTVTAVFQGAESPQSNTSLANVPSFAPTQLSVTVQ